MSAGNGASSHDEDALDVVDIDALVRPVGRVRVFARIEPVMPVDSDGYKLIQTMGSGGEDAGPQLDTARKVVARVVPTLTAEEIGRLTVTQIVAIISVCTRGVADVEKMIAAVEKKDAGPSSTTRVRPPILTTGPRSSTRSARSSSR